MARFQKNSHLIPHHSFVYDLYSYTNINLKSHVLYSSKKNCETNGHYARYNRKHLENGSVKERIQTLRKPSTSGSVL
jgi:hypothetical protein